MARPYFLLLLGVIFFVGPSTCNDDLENMESLLTEIGCCVEFADKFVQEGITKERFGLLGREPAIANSALKDFGLNLAERLMVLEYAKSLREPQSRSAAVDTQPALAAIPKRRTSTSGSGISAWLKGDLSKLGWGAAADVTLGRTNGGGLEADATCLSVTGALKVGEHVTRLRYALSKLVSRFSFAFPHLSYRTTETCDASKAGWLRYNAAEKTLEICDETEWGGISGGGGGSGWITTFHHDFSVDATNIVEFDVEPNSVYKLIINQVDDPDGGTGNNIRLAGSKDGGNSWLRASSVRQPVNILL